MEETVARLSEEVARLHEENAKLRRENAGLKQEAGYRRAMHARATEREAKLAKELEAARGEIRKLQARLFGQKSERSTSKDRSNHLPDPKDPRGAGLPVPAGSSRAVGALAVAITPICRLRKSSSSCPESSSAARRAVGLGTPEATRKTRSRLRSRCEPTAG